MTNRPTSPYLVWFDEYTEADRDRVGGKNASLGTMIHAGLPVPPGFAVTTDAYATLRRDPALRDEVKRRIGDVSPSDVTRLQVVSREVRELIEQVPLADDIVTAVHEAYDALCDHCGVDELPVAVRSSATAEDMPDASFAGQQDTFLWIQGADAVLEHMKRCWSSIFTDRAIAYRRERGYDHQEISMSVGVQKMVDPRSSGVAFTLNPIDGDRSQVAIDASWGLGEAVVSGEVTPDNYLVDKVILEVVSRKVSTKGIEYRVNGQGIEVVDIEPERQCVPCLTDDELKAVVTMAKRAERHYGRPQDIEWAIDRHLPDGENVILLQSRPETVWSNKKKPPLAKVGGDPMASIVATLMAPLSGRDIDQPSESID
jgi:pyruvate, water dikinase